MANNDPWGWESEFLRGIEFIDGKFRGDFDEEIKKIKEDMTDISDAVTEVHVLIDEFDQTAIRVNDEEALGESLWDWLQE